MLVKIGKYPSSYTTRSFVDWYNHIRFNKTKFDITSDLDKLLGTKENSFDRAVYSICDAIDWTLGHTINKYYLNRDQKVKIRIDYHDTFSADYTLSLIIHPLLVKFKEFNRWGAPYIDDEDVPVELRSTSAPAHPVDGVDGHHFARWDWVLDEMIWAFCEIANNNPTEDTFYSGALDFNKSFEKTTMTINGVEYVEFSSINSSFKIDKDGLDAYHKRIKNATRLFGKYYQNLWT